MYSIQEVSQKTGLTAHTLRYYEKEGLIIGVDRSLERLGLIRCLKNTGMSIKEISRFVQLTREGDHTLEERVALLRAHRDQVIAKMNEMQQYLDKVNWKLNFFSEKLKAYEARKAGESAK